MSDEDGKRHPSNLTDEQLVLATIETRLQALAKSSEAMVQVTSIGRRLRRWKPVTRDLRSEIDLQHHLNAI